MPHCKSHRLDQARRHHRPRLAGVIRQVTVGLEAHLFGLVADADGKLEGGDDEEGGSPVKGGDEPGEDGDHDAAGARTHRHEGQSAAATAAKPVGDSNYAYGAGGRAHPDGDHHDGAVEDLYVLNAAEEDKAGCR